MRSVTPYVLIFISTFIAMRVVMSLGVNPGDIAIGLLHGALTAAGILAVSAALIAAALFLIRSAKFTDR